VQGGILFIDSAPNNESLLATGGADSVVVVFDREAGRIRASLTGHTKKINGALSARLAQHPAHVHLQESVPSRYPACWAATSKSSMVPC
jgi:hypothetical protein